MIQFLLLMSRQGKIRLSKWYVTLSQKEQAKIIREVSQAALGRSSRLSNMFEIEGRKYVCRRYASLYFIVCVDKTDNELITLEIIHHFVEVLDQYFGNVCELDLIFNFHRAYFILDEVLLGGELQLSNKRGILAYIDRLDAAAERSEARLEGGSLVDQMTNAIKGV
ncbi:clathrin coat assembly protein ap19, putative [Leishmania panamensis]|uniref:AP complex subunit sigma n=1 Tax=Leishmania panamensis TaxID=5679 RepID=A0A088RVC1_LEIPA|nr:clathrin coat assembly protein ap19, putative [Leishmania panamensis]AIO00098.1 clathrin coat assembly protein ap19, putative [Leishmania panamensis]